MCKFKSYQRAGMSSADESAGVDPIILEIILEIIKNSHLKKYQKLSSILKYIFVDVCKIDQAKYYLLGSFAIREWRPINDLDIILDKDEFEKLLQATLLGIGRFATKDEQRRWIIDLTEIYNEHSGEDEEEEFSIEAFSKKSEEGYPTNQFSLDNLTGSGLDTDENGHQILSLPTLLSWKKIMGRPKDLPDIKLIIKRLKELGITEEES